MQVRAAAARVLTRVIRHGASLDSALPEILQKVAAEDRALVSELSYGTLRWQPRLAAQKAMRHSKCGWRNGGHPWRGYCTGIWACPQTGHAGWRNGAAVAGKGECAVSSRGNWPDFVPVDHGNRVGSFDCLRYC